MNTGSQTVRSILLVCQFFPPNAGGGRAYRASKLVKYWTSQGVRVVVLCGSDTVDPDKSLLDDVDPALLHIVRVDTGSERFVGLRRVLRQLVIGDGNLLLIWRMLDRLMKEQIGIVPDIVFTSSAPYEVHYLGHMIRKRWGSRWVADFRDPYTLNRHYRKLTPLGKYFDRRFERSIYQQADGVVFNTGLNKKQALAAFGLDDCARYEVFQNGFDADEFARVLPLEPPAEQDTFRIAYIGGIRCDDHELALLKAIQSHREELREQRVQFLFAGNGSEQLAAHLDASLDDGLIECLPFIASGDLHHYWNQAHALVLALPDSEQALGWVPQKLYSYLRAGRPILGIVPAGEAAEYLDSVSSNVVVSPGEYDLPDATLKLRRLANAAMDVQAIERFSQLTIFGRQLEWLGQLADD